MGEREVGGRGRANGEERKRVLYLRGSANEVIDSCAYTEIG